jgi:hypothetical protein
MMITTERPVRLVVGPYPLMGVCYICEQYRILCFMDYCGGCVE